MVQSEPERGSVYLSPECVSERFAGDGIRPAGSKTGGAARQESAQLGFRSCIWAASWNLVCGRLHVRHGENHAALCPVAGGFIPLRAESGPRGRGNGHGDNSPEYAEDKTFTVTTSDQTIATARIVNGDILVTGMKRGTCSDTVKTTNGVSAVISIKVVALMNFITRMDRATRQIFFHHMDEVFTVADGEGIDGGNYRFDPASEASGWVIPTRELVQERNTPSRLRTRKPPVCAAVYLTILRN